MADYFGNRRDGEEAVHENTPEGYREAFRWSIEKMIKLGIKGITSEDVVKEIGMPPNHPSAVGALMVRCAKSFGLKKIGTRQAVGRHQHILTVWGKK